MSLRIFKAEEEINVFHFSHGTEPGSNGFCPRHVLPVNEFEVPFRLNPRHIHQSFGIGLIGPVFFLFIFSPVVNPIPARSG
ncbi:hypothetical protein ES705_49703 [subsurface metagenome]